MYEIIASPVRLGGLTLKNRIIFAPTSLGMNAARSEQLLQGIAAGGCAMIIMGDVPVSRRGPQSLHNSRSFARYQRLCGLVHAQGCRVAAQLHQSDSDWKALFRYIPGLLMKKITPEQLRTLLNEKVGPLITRMPEQKAAAIAASFGEAALLAKKAGFDMVQIHGDRMCGSFSSILYNHRQDAYGGSAEKRARFAVEAVSAVRKALPDIPIDYKLAVRQENPHYGNAGVLLEELPVFVPLLEQAGVTSFHVTLANHGSLTDTVPPDNHPYFAEEGCFLRYCDEVRKYTNLPLCGVGGLSTPEFVETQLESGRIQCAAMSRQLIADPRWPDKVLSDNVEEIRRCIRCNRDCLGGIKRHEGVHCIYDAKPKMHRE